MLNYIITEEELVPSALKTLNLFEGEKNFSVMNREEFEKQSSSILQLYDTDEMTNNMMPVLDTHPK